MAIRSIQRRLGIRPPIYLGDTWDEVALRDQRQRAVEAQRAANSQLLRERSYGLADQRRVRRQQLEDEQRLYNRQIETEERDQARRLELAQQQFEYGRSLQQDQFGQQRQLAQFNAEQAQLARREGYGYASALGREQFGQEMQKAEFERAAAEESQNRYLDFMEGMEYVRADLRERQAYLESDLDEVKAQRNYGRATETLYRSADIAERYAESGLGRAMALQRSGAELTEEFATPAMRRAQEMAAFNAWLGEEGKESDEARTLNRMAVTQRYAGESMREMAQLNREARDHQAQISDTQRQLRHLDTIELQTQQWAHELENTELANLDGWEKIAFQFQTQQWAQNMLDVHKKVDAGTHEYTEAQGTRIDNATNAYLSALDASDVNPRQKAIGVRKALTNLQSQLTRITPIPPNRQAQNREDLIRGTFGDAGESLLETPMYRTREGDWQMPRGWTKEEPLNEYGMTNENYNTALTNFYNQYALLTERLQSYTLKDSDGNERAQYTDEEVTKRVNNLMRWQAIRLGVPLDNGTEVKPRTRHHHTFDDDPNADPEEKNVNTALEMFSQYPRLTAEEAEKTLSPGTIYVNEEGRIKRVPYPVDKSGKSIWNFNVGY